MIKGLAFLLFVVVAALIVGCTLYAIYRRVRRENDLDIQELNEAAERCKQAVDELERKSR